MISLKSIGSFFRQIGGSLAENAQFKDQSNTSFVNTLKNSIDSPGPGFIDREDEVIENFHQETDQNLDGRVLYPSE